MAGPLTGIRIVDFTRILAGPYATMLLADLGAEVIKIERPLVGDDTRSWQPPVTELGQSTYFYSVNRNKDSIVCDFTAPQDLKRIHELIASADVVIENFSPGTLGKFGLSYEQLAPTHPTLIYCSINGFGSTPAGAELPGYDLLIQALGGLMSVTGTEANPTKVGVAFVDVITGLHAMAGIQAALYERLNSGQGQHIEVSLLTSLLSAMVNQSAAFVNGGVIPRAMGNAHPSISPYETFQCADAAIVIAVGNDDQYERLCKVLGIDSPARFATNPARVAEREIVHGLIQTCVELSSADAVLAKLASANIPAGRINSIAQAFELAHQLGLNPIQFNPETGSRHVAHPIRLSRTAAEIRKDPPLLSS